MHVMPVQIDCNFIVDNTQADGISSLKGPTVDEVLMNSVAATPSATIAAGTIVVKLQDAYNQIMMVDAAIESPTSGSDVKIDNSALTPGVAYTITTLGNASAAKWLSIGVPAGVTPAVGVSFIASNDGGSGNTLTSRVQASASAGSGIASIEVVKSPILSPSSQIILQCRDYAGAIAAPAAGSKIAIRMLLNNSSVTVQGG